MPRHLAQRFLVWMLYAFATLQFIRYYVVSTRFYLKMPAYLAGHERLPFQERVLPIALMWPINHCQWLMDLVAQRGLDPETYSAATQKTLAFYLISLVSFSIAGFFVVRLYKAVTRNGTLGMLVYPIFLVVALWTYAIHIDANYSYPYDMPSLAFFTAGVFYVYTRRFPQLALVMLLGTLNRETTLFLIGLYLLDAASTGRTDEADSLRSRFDVRQLPWVRVAVLCAIWLAVKLPLAHAFAHNSRAEDYIRVKENIFRLKPRLLPSLLNICGYLMPVVWVLRNRIRPIRFGNYVYLFPAWIAVMFVSGVILETRIYGELSSFAAVAVVLLLEEHTRAAARTRIEPEVRRPRVPYELEDEATDSAVEAELESTRAA